MTVLVTGIRGSIGRRVADTLHAAGHDVRASSAAGRTAELDYPVATVDLNEPSTLTPALAGVDRVLLYAPEKPDGITAALRDSDVEQVVLISSASVADTRIEGIAAHHRAAEDAVRATGVRRTFLRPNVFARNSLGWSGGIRSGRVEIPYPDAYVEPIHEADIADAAVAALTGTNLDGREPLMTGPQSMTQRDQVATIAAALGVEVTVDALDPDVWRERSSRWLSAEAADGLLRVWADSSAPGPVHTLDDITGGTSRTFAQWVDDNLDAFRA